MSQLSKNAMIEATATYCKKNKNKLAVEQVLKMAELSYEMYNGNGEDFQDMDIDKVLIVFAVLRCNDERTLRNIHTIVSRITK